MASLLPPVRSEGRDGRVPGELSQPISAYLPRAHLVLSTVGDQVERRKVGVSDCPPYCSFLLTGQN